MHRTVARAFCALALVVSTAQAQVVISQVYGGGGNSGATLTNDFIEIFNRGSAAVSVAGWSVQYASSTGSSWQVTALSGTVAPGQYYLIQEAAGAGGTVNLPTPNASGSINMSATAGKVALVSSTTALSGTCPTVGVVDFVGFGSANCFEGTGPTATLSNTTAALRAGNGCTDTNSNSADFTAGAPNPRNTSSPLNPCGGGPTNPTGSGSANPSSVGTGGATLLTVAVTPGTSPASSGIAVTGDLTAIGGGASQAFYDDATHGDAAAGDNVFSLSATIPGATALGAKTLPITITDAQSRSSSTTIALTVNAPTIAPGTIVISQIYGGGGNSGATLRNDFIELFNRSDSPVTLDGWSVQYASSTAAFAGISTPLSGVIQPHGYFLIREAAGAAGSVDLPAPDLTGSIAMGATAGKIALVTTASPLSGTCPTGSNIVDFVGYGNANCSETRSIGLLSNTTAAFRRLGGCKETNNNSTDFFVAAPAPRNSSTSSNDCSSIVETPPPAHVVISQIYGGGGNGGAAYSNDFVELYNQTGSPVSLDNWSIQYASATGNAWGANAQPIGGTIDAHGYYLIQLASGGSAGVPLPPPRIVSDINIAATTGGKIALVSKVEGLTGNCPIGDPALIDFVGYGAADCYEGGLNAPVPGDNAGSMFRQSDGNVDTDQNSADFFVAAPPNPRGSGALVDLPPRITGSDPVGADAPFDASITINFSEPVTVTGPWFSIQCTMSGLHGDVEVASAFTRSVYILTPNVTFVPGEACTVHIAKNLITDEDGLPQNMPDDVEWTFTIATGTPVETADVHLTMGNPTGATWSDPNNYLMTKPEFAESYNRDRGTPNWVSWHLTDEWTGGGSGGRTDTFRPDPAIPREWYRVLQTDYSGSGFDRGHMCPSADRTTTVPINEATFLMTNMVPQAPDNNQGPWANLENYLRTLLPANELYIVSGPAGRGGTGSNGSADSVAGGHVTVPAFTWNAALVLPKGDDDLTRVTAATRTIAVIMPNIQGIRTSNPDDWQTYLTTVRQVEALCSCNLFSNLPAIVQNSIENGVNGTNPPGVADQSATLEAGGSTTITLQAVSPNASPIFTYSIVAPPSHGGLTGSTADRTYTPAPFFTGTDTFTFRVNDGSRDSITATVQLKVVDTTPPAMSALRPSTTQLWPPNHKMTDVTIAYSVMDLGDPSPACSLSVTSNEPVNGTGDGDTSPDWEIVDAHHVRLRAERAGDGNGRVYTVGADCADRSGNLAHGTATVTVPHDK